MNNHSLIAIDLAKNILQVCILNKQYQVVMNRSFNRKTLSEFIAKQSPSLIAMEACYSSHYWARLFQSYGHQVKLIPVPIKTFAQQDIQSLHRLIERVVSPRTGLCNQTRGLLSEYGIVIPKGFKAF